jgi:hypothetical protein
VDSPDGDCWCNSVDGDSHFEHFVEHFVEHFSQFARFACWGNGATAYSAATAAVGLVIVLGSDSSWLSRDPTGHSYSKNHTGSGYSFSGYPLGSFASCTPGTHSGTAKTPSRDRPAAEHSQC